MRRPSLDGVNGVDHEIRTGRRSDRAAIVGDHPEIG
jgi:hypothetical protein